MRRDSSAAREKRHDSAHGRRLIRRNGAALAAALAVVLAGGMTVAPSALAGVTPAAVDDPAYTVTEDQQLAVVAPGVLANDAELYPVRCVDLASLDETGLDGTLDIEVDGSFIFAADADFHGTTTFTYRMGVDQGSGECPEGGISNDATVTITVGPVNDPPTISALGDCLDDVTVAEDSGAYGPEDCVHLDSLGAGESDLLETWIVSTANPALFSAPPSLGGEPPTGALSFTPAPNAHGTTTISIRARDDGGTEDGGDDTSEALQVTIEVSAVNDAPVAVADSFFALANRTLNVGAPGVLINDSDIDDTSITAVKVSNPTHGVVTLAADGSFSYTPADGYSGPDAFSYRASDGSATSPARVVSITVSTVPPLNTPTPFPTVAPTVPPTPSPVPTLADPSASPEASATIEPGASFPATIAPSPSASLEPGATPGPDPSADEGGLSLPVLLVGVLLLLLLAFGAAVYVPKWLKARQAGLPMDDG